MRIFLDVGGHEGETLFSVLDPKYSFERIYVFEPVKTLHPKLEKVAGGRENVSLLQYGLWDKNTTQKIYSPGTLAGSLFAGHEDIDEDKFEICDFVKASEWFGKNITDADEVYMKLNCEGAEADIMLDLLQTKQIFKIKNIAIDFDVRKVEGMEGSAQTLLDKFTVEDFTSFSLFNDVMLGPSHVVRIQSWLDSVGANKTDGKSRFNEFFYWTKMVVTGKRPGYQWELKHNIKRYIPEFLLKLAGARRS
jgi:FkbM family methyltransferase